MKGIIYFNYLDANFDHTNLKIRPVRKLKNKANKTFPNIPNQITVPKVNSSLHLSYWMNGKP